MQKTATNIFHPKIILHQNKLILFFLFSSRCSSLRKIARHEETEFSNASILNSVEKFVKSVNEMEETILVPSRLLDLAVGDSTDTICEKTKAKSGNSIKDTLYNTDLFRLYNIVNQMKTDLLWSQENTEEIDEYVSILIFILSLFYLDMDGFSLWIN